MEYTLSPEAPHPTAVEEAYAATLWVANNGAEIGGDGSKLGIVGDGAGGNLAAVVALLAHERGGPRIAFQVLFCPFVDGAATTESRREFSSGYGLTDEDRRWYWDQYVPEPSRRRDALVSPLHAPEQALRGLPPALIITSELDVLRDEAEAYAHKLARAGVPVTATRYLGTIHGFMVINALAGTPSDRGAIAQAAQGLRSALEG